MAYLVQLADDYTSTNNSWADVITWTPALDGEFLVEVRAAALDLTSGDDASYFISTPFKRVSGTVTATFAKTNIVQNEDDATWDIESYVSGSDIVTRVRGDGSNNCDWFIWVTIYARA